jgi:hypothetical protein
MSGTTTLDTPGVELLKLSTTGSYDITAYGAEGGNSTIGALASGGEGAEIGGNVTLTAGEELEVIVGRSGSSGGAGVGGDGTFVFEDVGGVLTPLVVAGGGGGAGGAEGGENGNTATSGTSGNSPSGTDIGSGGSGGGDGGSIAGGGGTGLNDVQLDAGIGGAANLTFDAGGGGGGYSGGGGGGVLGGGGGGGSYFDGSALVDQSGVAAPSDTGNGEVIIALQPVCYLRGTRILTPTGEVLVESLKRGDSVVTRYGGLQRIKWIGRQSYRAAAVRENREHIPVYLRAGSLGEGLPARDLFVSPGHSMLIDGTLVLAKSLVNGITITQSECPERIDYFQIELEGHDCVIAEGTWSETYADWEEGRKLFHNAAEFHALFPDHHAPEAPILCAPRPERGAALDTALRPIVARAARALSAGPLRGYIDTVRGEWKLDGWAHDEAHPELPVLLEILLEGRVIGTVLACDIREDLLQAGFGQGRCSFTFISPIKLRPALLSTLQVRRAVDGAPVQVSRSILDAALEPAIVKPRLAIVA